MKEILLNTNIIIPHQKILIALSGGADSVCLLYELSNLSKEYNLSLLAAHLNHEWRGQQANQDEEFCKKLCEKLNIPFFSTRISQLQDLPKYNGSKENYARQARKKFLQDIANKHQADAIALAHHHDDQIETFFIKLIRGCSLAGLTGMKPKQGLYIRPLLQCSKAQILEFLEKHTITYTYDASNDSDEFLRNRIRKYVIPALKNSDKRAHHNILEIMNHLQEAESYLENITQHAISTLKNAAGYNIPAFLAYPPYMQYRIMNKLLIEHKISITLQQSFLQECIRFLKNNKSKSHSIHTSCNLVKIDHHFNFEKIL